MNKGFTKSISRDKISCVLTPFNFQELLISGKLLKFITNIFINPKPYILSKKTNLNLLCAPFDCGMDESNISATVTWNLSCFVVSL